MTSERTPEREPDAGSPDLNSDPLPYQLALKNRALASAAEGITISDARLPDNPLIYANRGFEEITGYSREESIGRNCRFLQGSDTGKESLDEIRSAIAEERPCVVELLNYRKDGTPFWNRLSLTPLRDEADLVTHFIGVQSDVTRRRLAEDALHEANTRLESINRRMQRDLDAAASIQKSLLPDDLPEVEGVAFSWFLESCDELAGDTLNVIPLDEDHLGLYVLDVSGHGVPAALLSVTLHRWLSHDPDHSLLRSAGSDPGDGQIITPPAGVAERLNRQFPLDPEIGQYFTMIYGILTLSTREFRYVTAGHPSLIHVPDGGNPHQPESASTPIGFLADVEYENKIMILNRGDRLYLFSDGLTELQDEGEEFLGAERLLSLVGAHRHRVLEESVRSIISDARSWAGNGPLEDDLTLLGVEIA